MSPELEKQRDALASDLHDAVYRLRNMAKLVWTDKRIAEYAKHDYLLGFNSAHAILSEKLEALISIERVALMERSELKRAVERIAELEGEVSKLHTTITHWMHNVGKLESENERLREALEILEAECSAHINMLHEKGVVVAHSWTGNAREILKEAP